MTNLTACPTCGTARPASRTGTGPWCCSIACYRSFHGIGGPEASSSDDVVTMSCPVCQHPFAPVGRQRYCSHACRDTAYRRRRHARVPPTAAVGPTRSRPITVYECDGCGTRAVVEQRCDACRTVMRRVGIGGCCPSCERPVALAELLGTEVPA